ncbi:LysR substrate-binding domain-containing protein [Aurantiacibacter flavus]|uniref:LysR substrate-binding domain-containing protein n=1 Tax=Aurantiacibacter flavus TaxID=3145232 RepID=A0ABV0CRX1_9SPHN
MGKLRDSGPSSPQELSALRVAAGHYLLDNWLGPTTRDLLARDDMPEIQFTQAVDRAHVLALLRNGEVDCGFCTGDPAGSDEFVTRVLRRATVGLYAVSALAARSQYPDYQLDLVRAGPGSGCCLMTIRASRSPRVNWCAFP